MGFTTNPTKHNDCATLEHASSEAVTKYLRVLYAFLFRTDPDLLGHSCGLYFGECR
jgi:hypothetical protein